MMAYGGVELHILTSALDGGAELHALAALPLAKEPSVPIGEKAGSIWTL
jgi:hypothetical protein